MSYDRQASAAFECPSAPQSPDNSYVPRNHSLTATERIVGNIRLLKLLLLIINYYHTELATEWLLGGFFLVHLKFEFCPATALFLSIKKCIDNSRHRFKVGHGWDRKIQVRSFVPSIVCIRGHLWNFGWRTV